MIRAAVILVLIATAAVAATPERVPSVPADALTCLEWSPERAWSVADDRFADYCATFERLAEQARLIWMDDDKTIDATWLEDDGE